MFVQEKNLYELEIIIFSKKYQQYYKSELSQSLLLNEMCKC